MADEFVQNFRSLPPEHRLTTLRQLSSILTHRERQEVTAAISEKNDIIPALPVELIIQVFSYLPILDAWSLQLVGRRWRRLLSSDHFLRAMLSRWDTHDPEDSGRSADSITRDTTQQKLQHFQATRLGKPCTVEAFETGEKSPILQSRVSQRRFDLKGSKLKGSKIAHISSKLNDGDAVVVRDLTTGESALLRGEAKERIMSVVLTTTLVAFITFEGTLYVAEFTNGLSLQDTSRIRLPSSRVRAAEGCDGTIALAMGGIEGENVTEILIYETKTQRLRAFQVKDTSKSPGRTGQRFAPCSLLVNKNQTLDIFGFIVNETAPSNPSNDMMENSPPARHEFLRMTHTRISSLDGQVIQPRSICEHPVVRLGDFTSQQFSMLPPQPTGYKGKFRVVVANPLSTDGAYYLPAGAGYFDASRGAFCSVADDLYQPENLRLATLYGRKGMGPLRDPEETHAFRCGRLTPHARWKEALGVVKDSNTPEWQPYACLMNDTFVVSLEDLSWSEPPYAERRPLYRIRVFCFDEMVRMPGAVSVDSEDVMDENTTGNG